ncbi:PKD domain-containing protein [Aquimarina sp. 2201CG1-2-11]|uniref:PKD domain-containing protein n=1 Tax=Aquimarina discodermiae TaxID=3231043 RepID=UPI0034624F22
MNNKLATITTQYRKFNDNQALTADQLNEFIDFFEDQDRLSRTRLSGVGLACGFKTTVRREGGEQGKNQTGIVTITQGVGVTTDGDILTLRDRTIGKSNELGEQEVNIHISDKEYTHYRIYTDQQQYPHFDPNILLWEIRNVNEINEEEKGDFKEIKAASLRDKIALLYLEDYENEEKPCVGIDCDNQGEEQVANLRVLLTDVRGAGYIAEVAGDSIYNAQESYEALYVRLPEIEVARVILSPEIDNPEELKTKFEQAIAITDLNGLITGIRDIISVFGLSSNLSTIFPSRLNTLVRGSLPLNDFQYRYDLLKDLVNTYNEVKSLVLHLKFQCNPSIQSFAKHIMLGPVEDPLRIEDDVIYRHDFYKSPILADGGENYKKLLFLMERFEEKVNFSFTKGLSRQIKVTPSQNSVLLGNRAIPFYYDVHRNFAKKWNFEKTSTGKELYNLSHDKTYLSSDVFVQKPLHFCLENFDFFRIEGHLGQDYELVYQEIDRIKTQYGLPFRVVAIGLNEESRDGTPSVALPVSELRNRLAIISKELASDSRSDVEAAFTNISILDKQLQLLTLKEEVRRGQPGIGQPGIGQPGIGQPGIGQPGIGQPGQPEQPVRGIPVREEDVQAIPVPVREGTEGAPVPISVVGVEGNQVPITRVPAPIQEEEEEIETELLSKFMERHAGLEHKAGVEPGGTFVLVYYVSTRGTSLVVADFTLPYICCTKKDPVLLSIPADKICAYEEPIPLAIIPLDGEIKAYVGTVALNAIIKNGDQNLFDPGRVPATYYGQPITFKINEESVESEIMVYPAPNVTVEAGEIIYDDNNNNATVTFNVSSTTNPSLSNLSFEWDFRDGNQSTASPVNGIVQHTYALIPGEEGTFKPEVRITNTRAGENSCMTVIDLEVSLKLVINKDTKIRIYFDNSGSMLDTIQPLIIMRDNLLKDKLLPLYGGDLALYNENVEVIIVGSDTRGGVQPANTTYTERTFAMLNLLEQTPPEGNVIALVFQDEANSGIDPTKGYHTGNSITPRRIQFEDDITNFRRRLVDEDYFGTSNPNYYRGVVFQVNGTNMQSGEAKMFQDLVKAVESGNHSSYPSGYNLKDRREISFVYGIEDGETAEYYLGKIVEALIDLGYDQLR